MSDNPNSIDSQPFNASGPPCTRKELVELSLGSMPPVQGDTEEERLEAAFERTVRAFSKADTYLHRFDSPEQQAQELAEILSARSDTYQIADPESLSPDSRSALMYLEKRGITTYKKAKGLVEAIDALNVWLESNRDEIKKWLDTKLLPRPMLARVAYSEIGMRATIKPGPKTSIGVNTANLIRRISAQNLEMFVQLRAAKEAWDARRRRVSN